MRITCPNCTAQYEIDADLLPPEGREVQCSECDTIWFQTAPMRKPARPATALAPEPIAAPLPPQPEVQIPTPTPAPPEPEQTPPPPPRVRALDPSVTQLLREEAEFEARLRAKEAEKIETQPDLGLLGSNPWPAFGNPDELDDPEPLNRPFDQKAAPGLPDIDDVSASLDPVAAPRTRQGSDYGLPQTPKARQREFLKGFSLPVMIGAALAGLYALAPALGDVVPFLSPVTEAYAAAINEARQSLAAMFGR
jgi:predicted Zn finger-like uncharacterized protein